MELAIETTDLTKRFPRPPRFSDLLHPIRKREPSTVLRDLNLKITSGELFCLLGPNGAGKTTLMKILATLILPTSGQVLIRGLDVVKHQAAARRAIGLVVCEERSFYWRLTGRQNLRFFAILNNLSKPVYETRIDELLELLELKSFADQAFRNYSTGTKQKFAIARGLLTEPEILLMDEPTRSVDQSTRNNLKKFIRQNLVNTQGKTVVYTTHDLAEAEELGDRIAILQDGRIRVSGKLSDIREKVGFPPKRYLLELGNPRSQFDALQQNLAFNGSVDFDLHSEMSVNSESNGVACRQRGEKVLLMVNIHDGKVEISDVIASVVSGGGKIEGCRLLEPNLSEIYDKVVQ